MLKMIPAVLSIMKMGTANDVILDTCSCHQASAKLPKITALKRKKQDNAQHAKTNIS